MLTLPRYVFVDAGGGHKHLVLRSGLPDSHPDSWPSQYREATGQDIPDDWRDHLVVPSKYL